MNVRHFQKHFSQATGALKPGQKLPVTKRGKLHGWYERAGDRDAAYQRRTTQVLAETRRAVSGLKPNRKTVKALDEYFRALMEQ